MSGGRYSQRTARGKVDHEGEAGLGKKQVDTHQVQRACCSVGASQTTSTMHGALNKRVWKGSLTGSQPASSQTTRSWQHGLQME